MTSKASTLAKAGGRCLTVALGILSYLGMGGELTVGTAIAIVTSVLMTAVFYVAAYRRVKGG